MDFHIVERVELPTEEIVQEDCRIERRLVVHKNDIRRKVGTSGIYYQELSAEVRPTIRHLDVI